MMILLEYWAYYLLIGIVPALLLELACRKTGYALGHMERVCLIVLWPFMALVFIRHFLKGFFKDK